MEASLQLFESTNVLSHGNSLKILLSISSKQVIVTGLSEILQGVVISVLIT